MLKLKGKKIFITGTDTNVGKTVVSAGLCMIWPACYWKPVQAGYNKAPLLKSQNLKSVSETKGAKKEQALESKAGKNLANFILPGTDNEVISQFIPTKNIYPSAYNLKQPLSPNQAAKLENTEVKIKNIKIPESSSNLIIEGAGGALVPLNDKEDMTCLMQKADCLVIVVARSSLGTLNHTFLTLSALKAKNIPVLGVIMVGDPHPLNKKDIQKRAPVLLELPFLKELSVKTLRPYFEKIKLKAPKTINIRA